MVGPFVHGHAALAESASTMPVRLQVGGPVAGVDLLVFNRTTGELAGDSAMRPGDRDGLFSGALRVGDPGYYELAFRVRRRDGASWFHKQRLQVGAQPRWHPVLVLRDADYPPERAERLEHHVEQALASQGRQATFLVLEEAGSFGRELFDLYLRQGRAVIWAGQSMSDANQAAPGEQLAEGDRPVPGVDLVGVGGVVEIESDR
jgi:hypothetical protein